MKNAELRNEIIACEGTFFEEFFFDLCHPWLIESLLN